MCGICIAHILVLMSGAMMTGIIPARFELFFWSGEEYLFR